MGECFMFGRGRIQPWAPDSTFANNDWKSIVKAVQKGVVPDTWKVGDQKAMTINGTDYLIDIIGKNHDDYADGSGKAPLTFQMHDAYTTAYAMNSSATNESGWTSCVMRTSRLPGILALMPDEVQEAVREVKKLTSGGYYGSAIKTTNEKLFLLSEFEVWGTTIHSVAGEGSRYEYYANTSNTKRKKRNGNDSGWWLRSPQASSWRGFCSVDETGSYYSYTADIAAGVSFAFCF